MEHCLTANTLVDVLDGTLTVAAIGEVKRHLEECRLCSDLFAEMSLLYETGGMATAAGQLLEPGATVGRYQILGVIGSGAMGTVYAASDPLLDRRVALKLVHNRAPDASGAVARARQLREAQAMARLHHPHVVAVHDVGTIGEQLFIAMELVDGETLADWLRRPRGWRQIRDVFLQAGRGLAAAHAVGLVHRDFKPSNVMIGSDGRVRVMDFGLARPLGGDEPGSAATTAAPASDPHTTTTGMLVGTPAYMAPEQLLGKPADASSDQFSFCVALYEALFGERPFDGSSIEELSASVRAGRIRSSARTARSVPQWLRRILLRGLSDAAVARFPSMDALIAALAQDPAARRRSALLAGLGVVVAASLALAVRHSSMQKRLECRSGAERLAGVWDAATKARMHGAFTRSGKPYAETVWHTVAAKLDSFARAWTGMHDDACEATYVRGEQSPELLDLRMACLQQRLDETAAITSLLASADARMVERAVQIVQGSDNLAACADTRSLRQTTGPPTEPARRVAYDALERQLAELSALNKAGRHAEGRARADAVVAAARKLDHPVALSDALRGRGIFQRMMGDAAGAEASLHEAAEYAERGSDDGKLGGVWANLASAALDMGKVDEAVRWLHYAAAADARASPDPLRQAFLQSTWGKVYELRSQFADAVASRQRAADLFHRIDDAANESFSLAHVGQNLGDLGRLDDAFAACQAGRRLVEEVLGPEHPRLIYQLECLADLHRLRGEPGEAAELDRQQLALQAAALGSANATNVPPLANLALALVEQRHFDEALATVEKAETLTKPGQLNPSVQWRLRLYKAQALLGMGQAAVAMPLLDECQRASGHLDLDEAERIAAQFALASALWHDKPQRTRALQLARDAAERSRRLADVPLFHALQTDLEQWLRAHAPAENAAP
jgi:tRNA A-37 threonylcarbamoyl transferase component Bud32/tetratricopeptide (TPR) repeat protein